jgi:ABC-type Mn2+/Zn2+ transport system ATPase subunit
MNIIFHKLKKENIFCAEFENMQHNNVVEFSDCGIVIIYGPNGIGKTSLTKIFKNELNSEYKLSIDGQTITNPDSSTFHIIEDQNGRDIIQGSTEDFVLGDNIRREYELKELIDSDFNEIFSSKLIPELRQTFAISTKISNFAAKLKNLELRGYISDLANIRSKGKGINRKEFIDTVITLSNIEIPTYDEKKFIFLVSDYKGNNSIIDKIMKLDLGAIKADANIQKIEEHEEAIKILEKYYYLDECIVCDSEIDRLKLLEQKRQSKDHFYELIDENTKEILEGIVRAVDSSNDPFEIKETLLSAIKIGDSSLITKLRTSFNLYFDVFNLRINNLFADCLSGKQLLSNLKEYEAIIQEKPEFSHEDILFIEKFINECIEKKIELKRDPENNIKLLLGDKELLNQGRKNLKLSNGEQNFISLAFELLKAKKVDSNIIVLDDPISSFDSIYKNKIAYSIVKFLEDKKQIILTHSTDLIKLLEHQKNGCFNLYLLNNTEGEENGFIQINKKEQNILLYIYRLLELFRSEIKPHILDEKNFLISTIPFMRGYCQIINDKVSKEKLTKTMHGYETEKVNVTEIYNNIFNTDIIEQPYEVSADEIMTTNIESLEILNKEYLPLLNKTLRHTLTYLYLRLSVEKKLVDKFSINTKNNDTLNKIINQAFNGTDPECIKNRIFLLSRKTLLNEFNHFEIDMNIFQPAIDITDTALNKEKHEILNFLSEL